MKVGDILRVDIRLSIRVLLVLTHGAETSTLITATARDLKVMQRREADVDSLFE